MEKYFMVNQRRDGKREKRGESSFLREKRLRWLFQTRETLGAKKMMWGWANVIVIKTYFK